MKSKNTTAAKNCDVIQSVANKFNVGGSFIKHVNGYVIGGKIRNCNVYLRPFHRAKVRRGRNEINVIILSSMLKVMIHPIRWRCRRYCKIYCWPGHACKIPNLWYTVSISNSITRKGKHQHQFNWSLQKDKKPAHLNK